MKQLALVLISLLTYSWPCHSQSHYIPQNGDLLFVTKSQSDFSEAISIATATNDYMPFVHVAIISIDHGQPRVIEASDHNGVVNVPLSEFIASASLVNGRPGIVVKRVVSGCSPEAAAKRAHSFIGLPYDWSFLPDNNKIYCSELVYECFLNDAGEHVFNTLPMNFRDATGKIPDFWVELFKKTGENIPEGIAGTNPNDMSTAEFLVEIYRFF